MGSDERLMARMTLTTAVVTLVVAGGLVAYFDWVIAANFVLGCALGLGSFAVLHHTVMAMGAKAGPGEKQSLTGIALLQIGKFLVLGIAFYVLFATGKANAPALAAGVTLPTVVLCLTEAGRRINKVTGVDRGQTPAGDEATDPPADVKRESN